MSDRSQFQRRPRLLWWLAAASLVAALAVPFFVVDVPPVLDYPNHLARFFVLAHPNDPMLSQFFAPHWRIVPNVGTDVLGSVLLRMTDPHVGGRMLLALCCLAPVVGVTLYHAAAFGRLSYWPLASGLVAYNAPFFLGFMNFLLSLGLAFAAASVRLVLRRRHSLRVATAFGALASVAIFFCHVFGLALFLLLVFAEETAGLYRGRVEGTLTAREAIRIVCALMLTAAPAALLYIGSSFADAASLPSRWHGWAKLLATLSPVMTTSFDLTLVSSVILASGLLLMRRSLAMAPAFPVAMAILTVTFLIVPSTIKNGTFVDIRIMLMLALLLFAGLSPRLPRRAAFIAGLVLASLILARTAYITASWIGHRTDLEEVRAAISNVQAGSKVLVARGHPGNDTDVAKPTRALPGVYRLDGHLGALLAIERKAFWPLMFADPAQQPIDVLPPYKAISQSPGEPVDLPLLQTDDRHAPSYIRNWRATFDDVLLLDPPTPLPQIEGLVPASIGSYAVLYRVERRR